MVTVNLFRLTRPCVFEQIALFLTFLLSVVYFLSAEFFKTISKKYIERLLLLQCITALLYSFAEFRLAYLEFAFMDIFQNMFIYGAFYVLLYLSVSFNISEIYALWMGGAYIVLSIINPIIIGNMYIPNMAFCVLIALYALFCFTFESLSYFDLPKSVTIYITDDLYDNTHLKNIKRSRRNKRIKIISTVAATIIFILSVSYLLLINFDIMYDVVDNKPVKILCYGSLSILMVMLSCVLIKISNNSKTVKIIQPYLFAILATLLIICINSAYHFIEFNTIFNWDNPTPYFKFIFSDLTYSHFGGWLRYPAVFLFNIILQYAFCHMTAKYTINHEDKMFFDIDQEKLSDSINEFSKPDFEE